MNIPNQYLDDVEKAKVLFKKNGCKEAYIFGSIVQNNAKSTSDIDFAIKGCPPNLYFYIIGKINSELKHNADIINLDHEDAFSNHLLKTQIMLKIL